MKIICQNIRTLTADAVDDLKRKAIKDYNKFLKSVYRGYKNDYNELMSEINFIEIYKELDDNKLIFEYYINHEL